MLIHIKPSKTLTKWLLKQKNQPNSIKTRVNQIQQALLLPNRVSHHMISNLIKEWSLRIEIKKTRDKTIEYDKRYKLAEREDMQY